MRPDPATSAKIAAVAHVLAGEQASEDRLTSATDFARAHLELLAQLSTALARGNLRELINQGAPDAEIFTAVENTGRQEESP